MLFWTLPDGSPRSQKALPDPRKLFQIPESSPRSQKALPDPRKLSQIPESSLRPFSIVCVPQISKVISFSLPVTYLS
ncbi:hypothetical protein MSWHS_1450 [Methanosarcina sp. WWM596]|nr:hypothetical protein MSWHS_1450 [Methanosarcina sp. WWM596]AKB22129.1 hypothetical protein MSWH1_1858 [Methanosarcina sp. WH1]